jgi:PAS domain S-box-containing protein
MADARVLIVEDDGITARYVQGCLRGHGFGATTVVASGRDALREAAALDPDLMVVDIRLREDDLDGVETVRQVRQHSDVPVIYLTGYSDDDTIRRAGATSPQGYIVKPFQQRELIAAVEIALRDRARRRAAVDSDPYRSIVENQVEMVCRFRPDGTLTYVNAACCQAFGKSREALLGTSFWSLIAPPDREAVQRGVALLGRNRPAEVHEQRALALSAIRGAGDADVTQAEPELRWQQWSTRAFLDSAGGVTEYQAVGRDITERRQREADRDQRLGELHEALERRRPVRGMVPICASCKRIRNERDEWEPLEGFLRDHYGIEFTHGLCPECMERLYPDYPPPSTEAGAEPEPEADP